MEGEDIYNTGLYMDVYYKSDENLEKEAKEKNTFYNTRVYSNKVYGDIDINDDSSYIFTSIPFNEGWEIRANSNKVETFKVNNGFLGFKLDRGHYKIEASFSEKGQNLGFFVSFLSFIILILLFIKSNYKKYVIIHKK